MKYFYSGFVYETDHPHIIEDRFSGIHDSDDYKNYELYRNSEGAVRAYKILKYELTMEYSENNTSIHIETFTKVE